MNYPRRQRRRREYSITGAASKALVAYGVYKVASWAWTKWQPTAEDECDEHGDYQHQHQHEFQKYVSNSNSNNNNNNNNNIGNIETHDNNQHFTQNNSSNPPPPHHHHHHHHHATNNRKNSRKFMRKRRHQINKCYLETTSTLETFMNILKSSIETKTDFSPQTKKLKLIRKQKQKNKTYETNETDNIDVSTSIISSSSSSSQETLWNEIKIKSMTRMLSSLYVHTILYLLLTVQIHLLGGRICRDNDDNDNDKQKPQDQNNINMSAHNTSAVLMQTYAYFFEKGIVALVEKLTKAVEKETQNWVVMNGDNALGSLTIDDFMSTLDRIRSIEGNDNNLFVDFITQPQSLNDNIDDDGLVQNIIDETLDIMESPVFEEAAHESLHLSFDTMKGHLQNNLFGGDMNNSILLVHVFGKLKKTTNTLYEQPQVIEVEQTWGGNINDLSNIYVKAMDRLDTLKELGDISFN